MDATGIGEGSVTSVVWDGFSTGSISKTIEKRIKLGSEETTFTFGFGFTVEEVIRIFLSCGWDEVEEEGGVEEEGVGVGWERFRKTPTDPFTTN